jgi:hypothetical protein
MPKLFSPWSPAAVAIAGMRASSAGWPCPHRLCCYGHSRLPCWHGLLGRPCTVVSCAPGGGAGAGAGSGSIGGMGCLQGCVGVHTRRWAYACSEPSTGQRCRSAVSLMTSSPCPLAVCSTPERCLPLLPLIPPGGTPLKHASNPTHTVTPPSHTHIHTHTHTHIHTHSRSNTHLPLLCSPASALHHKMGDRSPCHWLFCTCSTFVRAHFRVVDWICRSNTCNLAFIIITATEVAGVTSHKALAQGTNYYPSVIIA